MQYLGLLIAGAAAVSAGGVTSAITPTGAAPAGCTASYSGTFEIEPVIPAAKRAAEKRAACGSTGTLIVTLQDGILKDSEGRTGYIASNYQFQFDGPPQAGAIYTAGFSVCGNSSLALGDSAVFYQCQSGSFYNLYNKDWAPQCKPVAIDTFACGSGVAPSPAAGTTGAPAAQSPDGQPTAGAAITQSTDGQPEAPSAAITQSTDGQPEAPSPAAAITESADGQPEAPTPAAAVTESADGQPEAPTAAPAAPSIKPATGAAAYYSLPAAAVAAVAGLVGLALL